MNNPLQNDVQDDEYVDAPAPSQNGHQPPGKAPSVGDMFFMPERTRRDIVHELITTSTEVEEFISRSWLSKDESADIQAMYLLDDLWQNRQFNLEDVIWRKLAFSLAEEGRARRQAVQAITPQPMAEREGGLLGRRGGRKRDEELL